MMRTAVTSHDTIEKARKTADDLVATARAALRDLEYAARAWAEQSQENLGSLSQSATDVVARGRREAANLADRVGDRIQERPWPTMLAVGAAGLLLGWFLTRRR